MQKIRLGLVGGGPDAFIGAIHRHAAWLDGGYVLHCAALSRHAEVSINAGSLLGIKKEFCYPDYKSMFVSQKNLPAQERMHCVAIVTPNNTHHDIASLALDSGFHVLCEKPATFNVEQAQELKKSVEESGRVFAPAKATRQESEFSFKQ